MRGVNKLVVEYHPESKYFEKALLFLKPEAANFPQKDISDDAEKLIVKIKENRKDKKISSAAFILVGTVIGSVFSWLIILLTAIF